MDSSARTDWLNLIRECEDWVRLGDSARLNGALGKIPQKSIPRRFRLPLANAARRAGLNFLGLRLLSPALKSDPAPAETAEYGVLLQKIGSLREALELLEKIDSRKFPDVLLFRCFCLFPMWDYEAAKPLLEEYVAHPALTGYARAIGKVNLASAYIYTGEQKMAIELLGELAEECDRERYSRLHGNTLELTAQLHVRAGRWALAKHCLESAAALLAKDFSLDYFFVRKWSALMEGLKSGRPEPVLAMRNEAVLRRHWESVRECDLYIARLKHDESLFHKLYAGTPYPSYRKRLREEFPSFTPPRDFSIGNGPRFLDLSTAELDGRALFKPGMALHRFALFLFADLYKPQRLAAVFAGVFPDERFNVFSSPNRVHQLAKRFRETLSAEGLNLHLNSEQGAYSVDLVTGVRVLLKDKTPADPRQILLTKLGDRFGQSEFSAREAREFLKISLTGFNRLLNFALNEGRLRKAGLGPRTRYKCASSEFEILKKSA